MRKRILTGDRPTGKLHLGHLFGSLKNRVALQEKYETYILIADVQALTDNFLNPQKVRENVLEVAMDNLAVGINPNIATLCVQSLIPEIAELTVFFSNLVTIARLERNPTVKEEIKQKANLFKKGVTMGFLGYPVSQAADILSFRAEIVPVGADQLPMIEQTREIVHKFNSIYGKTFNLPKAIVSKFKRIKGLDGKAKMGKSLDNAIFLADSPQEIERKIMKAFTDPKKIYKNDKGHPLNCVVYQYQQIFSSAEELESIKERCERGKLGCVECKKDLVKKIVAYLEPIREKRHYFEKRPSLVEEILLTGTKKARKITQETMVIVRKKMRIDYFRF